LSRYVRIVILCEDKQHEGFLRRFIKKTSQTRNPPRVILSPAGRGSAEQFVRERFPKELKDLRSRGDEQIFLVVMVDGDADGVVARKDSFNAACKKQGVPPLRDSDRVLVCVPTWNIETWLAYLGGEAVDETKNDYPRLNRVKDRMPMVNELVEMCRQRTLREPAPASLEDTCSGYRRVFE
jgi:hypothetical protein